jgi:integrase/recombinase XerD
MAILDDFLSFNVTVYNYISALISEHVEFFVQSTSRQIGRLTLQHKVAHLRAFLRFAQIAAKPRAGLTASARLEQPIVANCLPAPLAGI